MEPNREFVIMTGSEGFKKFNKAVEISMLHMSLDLLLKDKYIELEEYNNLHKMINSPDDKDYQLAKIIIDTKYEHNI